jgi:hypothetical protein
MTTTYIVEQVTDGYVRTATFEIEFTTSPYDPGNTCGPPENCYPPEGGEIEDRDVTLVKLEDENGNAVELTDELCKNLVAWVEANRDAELDEACYEYANRNGDDEYDGPDYEWGD